MAGPILWYSRPELRGLQHANDDELDDTARGDTGVRVRSGGGLAGAGGMGLGRLRCRRAGSLRKRAYDDRRPGRRVTRRESPCRGRRPRPTRATLTAHLSAEQACGRMTVRWRPHADSIARQHPSRRTCRGKAHPPSDRDQAGADRRGRARSPPSLKGCDPGRFPAVSPLRAPAAARPRDAPSAAVSDPLLLVSTGSATGNSARSTRVALLVAGMPKLIAFSAKRPASAAVAFDMLYLTCQKRHVVCCASGTPDGVPHEQHRDCSVRRRPLP